LASALGVNPFFVRDYQQAARNYTIADCVKCIAVLREFDMKSKGYNIGDTSAKDLYREMIFKLLH
jgi:DNA polymerase-3 subunit delta